MTTTVSRSVSTTPNTTAAPTPRIGRFGRAGLAAGIGAAVANVAAVAAARQFDGSVGEIQDKAIPLLGFAQVTVFAAIIGVGLAALFTRRARRPRPTFVVTTVVLSALSMVPPVIVEADVATKLVLGLTHVVAAVIVIPAIAARISD
ncbi:MAG: DUF6069 family protein [Acidimicrobiales bacterium]